MRNKMQFLISTLVLVPAIPLTAAAQVGQPPRTGEQPPAPQAHQQPAETGQPGAAASPRPLPNQGRPEDANLVAMVNGEAITRTEFQNSVETTLRSQQRFGEPQSTPQNIQNVHQQVLDSLIESRLVEQYVLENGPDIEPGEVEAVLRGFEQRLQAQNLTLADFLSSTGQSEDHLRKRVQGAIGWQNFQREQLVPENLRRFYEDHQQQLGDMSFEEAEHQLPQLYIQKLWSEIVAGMKPRAQIEIVRPQPASPQMAPEQPLR